MDIKALPVPAQGESYKIKCCGTDRSTYIRRVGNRVILGPCFRCGFKSSYTLLNQEGVFEDLKKSKLNQISESYFVDYKKILKAVPFSDGPVDALLWTARYGLSPFLLSYKFGFCWSRSFNRVAMPVLLDEKETGAYQLRNVYKNDKPKYISLGTSKYGSVWAYGFGNTVFVEDILSAIKVVQSGYRAVSCLGTKITSQHINQTLGCPYGLLWFDPDDSGKRATKQAIKLAGMSETSIRVVQCDREPKELSIFEIREVIKHYM